MYRILYIVAMYLCVRSAFSIDCYQCNSDQNPLCNEGGLVSYLYPTVECHGLFDSLLSPKCVKLTAQGTDGSFHTSRTCMPGFDSFMCKSVSGSIGWSYSHRIKNLQCDTCNTDKCNLAERSTTITLLGVALALAILIF